MEKRTTLLAACLVIGLARTAAADPAPSKDGTASKPILQIEKLSAPESVLHDERADLYLVSNINGSPFARDRNGFISQISPSGEIRALKWIDGSRRETELNAPKGLALLGDTLYVADLDTVRAFDRTTGAAKKSIPIPGALFLNDIAAASDRLFVSDTAVKEGFKPAGTAAIYEVRPDGTVKPILRGNDLAGPNGLATRGDELWAVTFGDAELFRVNATGKQPGTKLPKGQLDGLVVLPDGNFLVTSWQASGIYAGRPGEAFTLVLSGVPSPADIGFDRKRSRLLVPMLQKDRVEIFDWTSDRLRQGRSPRR
jgi:hypothetical protein